MSTEKRLAYLQFKIGIKGYFASFYPSNIYLTGMLKRILILQDYFFKIKRP